MHPRAKKRHFKAETEAKGPAIGTACEGFLPGCLAHGSTLRASAVSPWTAHHLSTPCLIDTPTRTRLAAALSAATGTTATMSIQQEQKAQALLSAAVAFTEAIAALHESKLRLRAVHKHTLVTGGLFQHAGAALVDYAKANGIDLAVISSMRTAPAKRCLLKCVCLGGISGYCLHRMPCSVGIATVWEELDDTLTMESLGLTPSIMLPAADEVSSTKVCIAFDDSEPARLMVKWAAEKLLTKRDIVHVITVAREVGRVTDCHFQSQGNIDMAHRDYEVRLSRLARTMPARLDPGDGGRGTRGSTW